MTKPKATLLKTDRLLLRAFQESDIENVFKGLSDPIVTKYYGISFDSLAATKEQMTWFKNLEKEGTGKWFAVCSLDNQQFYGAGGLNNLSKEHKKSGNRFLAAKRVLGTRNYERSHAISL